uniref:Uncharacterized protein n=1 Tax=Equus caballus TaxID=9796 RepID=A0A9L0RVM6_HORSE
MRYETLMLLGSGGDGIAGSYSSAMFNFFEELPNCFPKQLYHFTFPPAVYEVSPHPCQHLLVLFIVAILGGGKWYLIMILICIFLITNDVEHLFMCSCPFVYLLRRNVYLNSLPIF